MRLPQGFLILAFLVSLGCQENLDVEYEDEENIDTSDIVPVPYDNKFAEQVLRAGGGDAFTYDYSKPKGIGPKLWSYIYPDYCNGTRQSPINLKGAMRKSFIPFRFKGYYKKPMKMMMANNGHTAVVTLEMDPMPRITGGGLDGTYEFLQMHWHWGKNEKKGSEHTLNGKAYPLELHLVHWKKSYGDVGAALEQPDGLAVLGIFVKLGSKPAKKSPYKHIAKKLKKIRKDGKSTELKPMKLKHFLPENTQDFFRYEGSLTTPTCNEVVIWTVFKQKRKIKKRWLKRFPQLKTNLKAPMVDNFRPVQKMYGRTIHMS